MYTMIPASSILWVLQPRQQITLLKMQKKGITNHEEPILKAHSTKVTKGEKSS
jgi:hypothetical protein